MATQIPFEIFVEYLLPYLSIKEIGFLSMVNSTWKEMCDDNEVWRIIYMRTIRAKILDTSIHIGGRYETHRDWKAERQLQKIPLYYKIDPLTMISYENKGITINPPYNKHGHRRTVTWWCRNSHELLNCHPCLSNTLNSDFVKTLKTWREIRTDGIDNDDFLAINNPSPSWVTWIPRDNSQYLSYIEESWINYNRENKLSTVNLCQCQDHYDFDTLGLPDGCRNYKSFKKMTLKKEKTKALKLAKKSTKSFNIKLRDYEIAEANLKKRKKEMLLAKKEDERLCKLCENLDNVSLLKNKKQVVGIAHRPPNHTSESRW